MRTPIFLHAKSKVTGKFDLFRTALCTSTVCYAVGEAMMFSETCPFCLQEDSACPKCTIAL